MISKRKDERFKTRRHFQNRYANKSNLNMDWKENIEYKGYRHPLGVNHTALDVYIRESKNSTSLLGFHGNAFGRPWGN